MIRVVLMFLLLVASSPAMAGRPSFLDQIRVCVATSVKYTEYATLANDSSDSDHGAFMAFVQQEADAEPSAKILFIQIGELAWLARANGGGSIHEDAMKLYDKCYNRLGTKT